MTELYVLNENLNLIYIIDYYKSLIWHTRYNDFGEFELYINASTTVLDILKKGYYLQRADDDSMVVQIKSVEIDDTEEEGDYLIVTGYDVTKILNKRIIWKQTNFDGLAEDYIRELINNEVINPADASRKIDMFSLSEKKNFQETISEQTTYSYLADKIKEICVKNGWGYRTFLQNKKFVFDLYKGVDRSSYVIFSNNYDNLISSKYKENTSNYSNVVLVAGVGEGSDRLSITLGNASGADRCELFVDAKDISKSISYDELTKMYPLKSSGGYGYIEQNGDGYYYKLEVLNITLLDSGQLEWFVEHYPEGEVITDNDNYVYKLTNITIAKLPNDNPEITANVELEDVIYINYLTNRGLEKLAESKIETSFEASVEPQTTFVYKKDYFLGDIVTVENDYNISLTARISEIIETFDDNGYSLEPKFNYIYESEVEEYGYSKI